jgi:8-oxo-dGTP pyrophosphatase MutT (NUDIX family)
VDDAVCAMVLLNDRDDALLQLRDDKPGLRAAGLWVFPGGHSEPGEDLVRCVEREFFEETEYRCENPQWLLSMDDAFLSRPAVKLHVFWETYRPGRSYVCREGQKLEFVARAQASRLRVPEYLIAVWDLAVLASRPCQ